MTAPQERYLYFPTAAEVTAPAGALSVFPHYRSSVCSRRCSLYFPTTAVVSCSRRSLFCTSPLPQQCLLPQERYLYFPTIAVVSAPAERYLYFPLPQQCLLPQEPFLDSSTAAAVSAPAGAFSIFLHCRSSVCSRRSLFYIPPLRQQCPLPQEPVSPPPSQLYFLDSAEVPLPQAVSSIPSALSYANFGGFTGPLWLLSRDNSILGEHSGSGLHAELGPLSPVGGSNPGLGNNYRARSPLLGQHANMHNPLFSLLYVSVNS